MNLLQKSLAADPTDAASTLGHFFLRVSAGLMIFYIHGWHKLEGGLAYLHSGRPWVLADEIAGMHLPAPFATAVLATLVQLVCSLFVLVGLFTRINAVLLTGVLFGAVAQNLLAGRDPQLALLYTILAITLALMGGGKLSLDAKAPLGSGRIRAIAA
jgi:putative oxidoreductase